MEPPPPKLNIVPAVSVVFIQKANDILVVGILVTLPRVYWFVPLNTKQRSPTAEVVDLVAVALAGLFTLWTLSFQSPITVPAVSSKSCHKTNFEYAPPAVADSNCKEAQDSPRYIVSEPSPSKRTLILSKFLFGHDPNLR